MFKCYIGKQLTNLNSNCYDEAEVGVCELRKLSLFTLAMKMSRSHPGCIFQGIGPQYICKFTHIFLLVLMLSCMLPYLVDKETIECNDLEELH